MHKSALAAGAALRISLRSLITVLPKLWILKKETKEREKERGEMGKKQKERRENRGYKKEREGNRWSISRILIFWPWQLCDVLGKFLLFDYQATFVNIFSCQQTKHNYFAGWQKGSEKETFLSVNYFFATRTSRRRIGFFYSIRNVDVTAWRLQR